MGAYSNILRMHRIWFDVWDEDQGDDSRDDGETRSNPEHTLIDQLQLPLSTALWHIQCHRRKYQHLRGSRRCLGKCRYR